MTALPIEDDAKIILRFDHCFRVPSDIDSAISGTLTTLSAEGSISVVLATYLMFWKDRHRKIVAAPPSSSKKLRTRPFGSCNIISTLGWDGLGGESG